MHFFPPPAMNGSLPSAYTSSNIPQCQQQLKRPLSLASELPGAASPRHTRSSDTRCQRELQDEWLGRTSAKKVNQSPQFPCPSITRVCNHSTSGTHRTMKPYMQPQVLGQSSITRLETSQQQYFPPRSREIQRPMIPASDLGLYTPLLSIPPLHDMPEQHLGKRKLQNTTSCEQGQLFVHVQSRRNPVPVVKSVSTQLLAEEHIRTTPHVPSIHRPKSPSKTQRNLHALPPSVLYTEYEQCNAGCRSRGTCLHYSFVLGTRRTPDGLICPVCVNTARPGREKGITADRMCPWHSMENLNRSNFVGNLPDDFLATAQQREASEEIWWRSWEACWEGVPGRQQRLVNGYRASSTNVCSGPFESQSLVLARQGSLPAAGFCVAPERMLYRQQQDTKRTRLQFDSTRKVDEDINAVGDEHRSGDDNNETVDEPSSLDSAGEIDSRSVKQDTLVSAAEVTWISPSSVCEQSHETANIEPNRETGIEPYQLEEADEMMWNQLLQELGMDS